MLTIRSILADEEVRQGLKAWVRWMIALFFGVAANRSLVGLANFPPAISEGGARRRS